MYQMKKEDLFVVHVFDAEGNPVKATRVNGDVDFLEVLNDQEKIYTILVEVDRKHLGNLHFMSVGGEKQLTPKPILDGDTQDKVEFEASIPVRFLRFRDRMDGQFKADTSQLVTEYTNNHFKAIFMDPNHFGKATVWNFGVIAQNNASFLVVCPSSVYDQCYKKNGKVTCPKRHNAYMDKFLTDYYSKAAIRLPDFSEYDKTKTALDVTNGLKPGEARIQFWGHLQGNGGLAAATLHNGKVAGVWWKEVVEPEWSAVVDGQTVSYYGFQKGDVVTYSHLAIPDRETSFKRDLKNIELVRRV